MGSRVAVGVAVRVVIRVAVQVRVRVAVGSSTCIAALGVILV